MPTPLPDRARCEAGAILPRVSTEESPALIVDVDTSAVRAFVLEHVEGDRRLVARVNLPVPHPAAPAALAAAVARATRQVRQLSADPEAPAAPTHLLTERPGPPQVLLVAPRADQAAGYALAALTETGAHLLEPLYMHGRDAPSLTSVAEYLRTGPADIVILLCAGRRQEWLPIQAVADLLAYGGAGPARPIPVVAGDAPEALAAVTQALGPVLPPAAAPATTGEQLVERVSSLRRQRTAAALHRDGIRELAAEPETPPAVSSSIRASARGGRTLARRYGVESYVMDVSVGHGAVYASSPDESTQHVRVDLGGQFGPATILREAGAEAVLRWLPTDVPNERLEELATLRQAYPNCPVTTREELLIEHAFLREQVHLLTLDAQHYAGDRPGAVDRPMDLLIAGGSVLAQTPRMMQGLLILLDALQPEGLTYLAVDRAGGLPVLGILGDPVEDPATPLLEHDAVLNAGLVVAPVGQGRTGQPAITVEVAYAERAPVTTEVLYGSLAIVPLMPGERAALTLRPEQGLDIGVGAGSAATPGFEIEGGTVGVIVDARGRPLELPANADRRQARLLDWFQSTGAYPPLEFVAGPEVGAGAASPPGPLSIAKR